MAYSGWLPAVILLTLMLQVCAALATENERVCGAFGLEKAMFDAWRDTANRGPGSPQRVGYSYQQLSLTTPDGQTLSGYRISKVDAPKAVEALLFIQGNAMRAEQLFDHLPVFAERGFDVFIVDFRGYGMSTGEPLLKPISNDISLITQFLRSQNYKRMYLYGISIGGVLALGPQTDLTPFNAVAIDSTPSALPWYAFCPAEFDPIDNLPASASKILVISGGRENVVSASAVLELGEAAKKNGGSHVHVPEFGHPFMDSDINTSKRFEIVLSFFARLK